MDCDPVDPCFFCRLSSGNRALSNGVLIIKVDDTLFTGTTSYLAEGEANAYRFPTEPSIFSYRHGASSVYWHFSYKDGLGLQGFSEKIHPGYQKAGPGHSVPEIFFAAGQNYLCHKSDLSSPNMPTEHSVPDSFF